MKKVFFLFFLISCSSPNSNFSSNNSELFFDEILSFVDFKRLLIEYAEKSPYPNIKK
jgi:hypothetical protein